MTYEIPGQQVTIDSSADLSLDQFLGIALDSSGNAVLPAAGTRIVGVLQNKPAAAGRACTVMLNGITKARAGEAIPAGSLVSVDVDGRFLVQDSTELVVGMALEAAVNANDLFPMRLYEN